jgi:3-oxoacyl-[acyl-carrier protein] reductase
MIEYRRTGEVDMSLMLENKVAIITGAGRGLGKAFALRFAREGAKLLLPDISLERSDKTAQEIRAKGGEAAAMLTDISDETATQEIAEKVIKLYGKVDILLNNAAWSYGIDFKKWDEVKVEDWDRMFAINVRGTWLVCKAIAPMMAKQSKGKIINIVSNTIRSAGANGILHYVCSKGAIYTMTQCLARTLGEQGINVNAIGPGLTATEANLIRPDHGDMFKHVVATQSIKRREEPDDLVGTAVYLASDNSDMVTGQCIFVDGGLVI